jgi:aspartyl-tRNA(Asn)/glutamyl-tRNA(Gln) amidotransferase subunit A
VSTGQSDDLTRMNIGEVADLVRKKKVSPVELTTACLARIDRFNPALNAFITVTAELALEQAREAEVRDITLPANTMETLRDVVRAAEAYAYHREFLTKTPELYQPLTLKRLRLGADVTTHAYIQGRRDLARVRRTAGKWLESVDALVTPTLPIPPPAISDPRADDILPTVRNTSPFDVNGWPAISLPCGFTTRGLPIGLQIVGPHGNEPIVFQLALAYEQATEWHNCHPQVPAGGQTTT